MATHTHTHMRIAEAVNFLHTVSWNSTGGLRAAQLSIAEGWPAVAVRVMAKTTLARIFGPRWPIIS